MARKSTCSAFALLLFLLLCLPWSACLAQTVTITPEQQAVCNRHHETLSCPQLVKEFGTDRELSGPKASSQIDTPFNFTDAFTQKVAGRAILKQTEIEFRTRTSEAAQTLLQTISTNAATNQNGGAPTASGSTNLVSKPTTTDFISLASESGAFTDTINGTTMTLQANALGLTKYFTNQPVFQRWESKYADVIQPLTFTATLNIAQTSSSTVPTTGSANAATPASIGSILVPTNNASFSSLA